MECSTPGKILVLSELCSGGAQHEGFQCGSSEYAWTLKVYKARRDRLQQLREECCTQLSSWSVPDFRRWAGLVEGHTQVNFRTEVQGIAKLHVVKWNREETGTGNE